MNAKKAAKIFKAFCDENRIRIIRLLQTGEKCGCNLLEDIQVSQPTLSHHMKILCDAEIVKSRKEGKWTHYSLSEEGMLQAIRYLQMLASSENEDSEQPCSQDTCSCR